MRKMTLAFVFVLLTSTMAFAQHGGGHGGESHGGGYGGGRGFAGGAHNGGVGVEVAVIPAGAGIMLVAATRTLAVTQAAVVMEVEPKT